MRAWLQVCVACQKAQCLLDERDNQQVGAGIPKKKLRRGGKKVRNGSGARNSSRASSASPQIAADAHTQHAGGVAREEVPFSSPRPGRKGASKEKDRLTVTARPLPAPVTRSSSDSDQEWGVEGVAGDGCVGVDATAGATTQRPESRLSEGSCVSFAGSEIELELCATDCASYLPL